MRRLVCWLALCRQHRANLNCNVDKWKEIHRLHSIEHCCGKDNGKRCYAKKYNEWKASAGTTWIRWIIDVKKQQLRCARQTTPIEYLLHAKQVEPFRECRKRQYTIIELETHFGCNFSTVCCCTGSSRHSRRVPSRSCDSVDWQSLRLKSIQGTSHFSVRWAKCRNTFSARLIGRAKPRNG